MPRSLRRPGEIEGLILTIRGRRVLLDRDLAALYGVTTKSLKQAVRRNLARFPDDFMLELTLEEGRNLRSQIETSGYGGSLQDCVRCDPCANASDVGAGSADRLSATTADLAPDTKQPADGVAGRSTRGGGGEREGWVVGLLVPREPSPAAGGG